MFIYKGAITYAYLFIIGPYNTTILIFSQKMINTYITNVDLKKIENTEVP